MNNAPVDIFEEIVTENAEMSRVACYCVLTSVAMDDEDQA